MKSVSTRMSSFQSDSVKKKPKPNRLKINPTKRSFSLSAMQWENKAICLYLILFSIEFKRIYKRLNSINEKVFTRTIVICTRYKMAAWLTRKPTKLFLFYLPHEIITLSISHKCHSSTAEVFRFCQYFRLCQWFIIFNSYFVFAP